MLARIAMGLPDMERRMGKPPGQMSGLVLAYVGDTLYDLYVRTMLIESTDLTARGLHAKAISYVCAAAQARAFSRVEPMLTQEELAIYKRGRNAHINTAAKNASIADYRSATGFEALVGFLYLSGMDGRLNEIMGAALCGAGIRD